MDVMFGLHINSKTEVGRVRYRKEGIMAAVNSFNLKIKGVQSHGAYPWASVDPIVTASQIIMNSQVVVSRGSTTSGRQKGKVRELL